MIHHDNDPAASRDRTPPATGIQSSTSDLRDRALYRSARPYVPPPELRECVLRSVRDPRVRGPEIELDDRGFPALSDCDRAPSRRRPLPRGLVAVVVATAVLAVGGLQLIERLFIAGVSGIGLGIAGAGAVELAQSIAERTRDLSRSALELYDEARWWAFVAVAGIGTVATLVQPL